MMPHFKLPIAWIRGRRRDEGEAEIEWEGRDERRERVGKAGKIGTDEGIEGGM